MQIPDASLRPWNKLVGLNGDLADVLLGILSLASARHGIARVRIAHFYQVAQNLNADFPFIPSSLKSLCGAMEGALQIGVVISSDFQHFVVSQNAALKNIGRLRNRMGESFLRELTPIASRFAQLARERGT
jgi:hypothetical protein